MNLDTGFDSAPDSDSVSTSGTDVVPGSSSNSLMQVSIDVNKPLISFSASFNPDSNVSNGVSNNSDSNTSV